jgi:Flp pilus assembly protein TadD
MPRRTLRLPVLLLSLLGCLPPTLQAADTPEPAPAAAKDPLADARKLINDRQWVAATAALRKVNQTRSADWNNLMGYTLRKSANPDLAAAERHYLEALRIDPRHLGALEYIGELYLMQGDLPKAEARLATLASACPSGCEELKDLKSEIERFKANGNRWVVKP